MSKPNHVNSTRAESRSPAERFAARLHRTKKSIEVSTA